MRRMPRVAWIGLLAVAFAVQFVVLYVPRAPAEPGIPGLDKLIHAGIFAAPMLVGLLARLPWVPLAVALAVHAVLSEIVQHVWLPSRSGDPLDALADLAGIALALAIGWRMRRRARDPQAPVDRNRE